MEITGDVMHTRLSGANAFSANGLIKINNIIILDDLSGHILWARPDRTRNFIMKKEDRWKLLPQYYKALTGQT